MMTDKIKQALINNKINVNSLIEQLCSVSGVKNRNVPIFDKEVFTKIQSMEDFWKTLSTFWSTYDYDILRFIIKITNCEDAQKVLKEFLSRTDPTIIEDADLVLDCRVDHKEGWLKPKLRIKINAERCNCYVKDKVKILVSKAYNLQQYTLCFKGIKEGCIELLFHISEAVMTHVLQCKITGRNLTEFSTCKIISIHIHDIDILVSNYSYIAPVDNNIFTAIFSNKGQINIISLLQHFISVFRDNLNNTFTHLKMYSRICSVFKLSNN